MVKREDSPAKEKLSCCFEPRENDLDPIWREGILTVDANVLLDLHRYHGNTRDSIILNPRKFEDEFWLPYQATSEFFRNRKEVITSPEETFKSAVTETDNLSKSLDGIVSKPKGNKITPNTVAEELRGAVDKAIESTREKIKEPKESYPKYLKDDPILERISKLPNDKIGEELQDLAEDIKQAGKRVEDKIPPGYKDIDRDDDKPYDDYLFWRQSPNYSKKTKRPLVLITSERKED